ncbi:hypothetical protein G9P44_004589 [Scheffersomyces stipitis]|nr:hypothetical protein G9P44_004589 [Scheffersomyces stipitis]
MYHDTLLKYKSTSLNQLALLCGLPTKTNKKARVDCLVQGLNMASKLHPKSPTILSVDIGIKNFSYCKVKLADLAEISEPSIVDKWAKVNLHDTYGSDYVPLLNLDTLIDSKRYINYICKRLVSDIVDTPDIVVMETQRTRSNNNAITLPNVLLNYTFENILYANLYNSLPKCVIVPMTSTSMINFWINRFVSKESLRKHSKSSKKIRSQLFFHWLGSSDGPFKLPAEVQDKKSLLKYLELQKSDKIDDLVDSLLYNLTIRTQVSNQINLLRWIDKDLNEFIIRRNLSQLNHIYPLIQDLGLRWHEEFELYIDYFFRANNTLPKIIDENSICEFKKLSKLQ